MTYLPNEIINKIFSYVARPKLVKLMKYLVEDCYEEDYDPYTAELWSDNFCFEYSFYEWYYLYRWNEKLGGLLTINRKHNNKKNIYKHTPKLLTIGSDRLEANHFQIS